MRKPSIHPRLHWYLFVLLGLALPAAPGCGVTSQARPIGGTRATQATGDQSAVAVVELFTSEGCSSSPPAEAQLRRVVARERRTGRAVFPLEFHVDYWNDLGWVDPFSDHDYTRRQWVYARAGGRDQVATPQMIVNGRSVLTGSSKGPVDRAIDRGLAHGAAASVDVSLKGADAKGQLTVSYRAAGLTRPAVLRLALVERGLVSHVTAGENRGRTLRHDNVVRQFKSVSLDPDHATGSTKLRVPGGVDRQRASVIAYAQNPKSMAVLGAAAVDLGGERKGGSRKAEVGSRKSEVGSRKSEVGSRKSGVGSKRM